MKLGIRRLDGDLKEQWFALYAIWGLDCEDRSDDLQQAIREQAMRALGDEDGLLVAALVAMHGADPTFRDYIYEKMQRVERKIPGADRWAVWYGLCDEFRERFPLEFAPRDQSTSFGLRLYNAGT